MCTDESVEDVLLVTNQPRNKMKYRGSWDKKQKNLMLSFFRKHIKNKILPKKAECDEFLKKYVDIFENKTWVQIKVFIYNTYRKNQ